MASEVRATGLKKSGTHFGREEDVRLCWHCTWADAIYRDHICKHVRGLLSLGRPTKPMTCSAASNAA